MHSLTLRLLQKTQERTYLDMIDIFWCKNKSISRHYSGIVTRKHDGVKLFEVVDDFSSDRTFFSGCLNYSLAIHSSLIVWHYFREFYFVIVRPKPWKVRTSVGWKKNYPCHMIHLIAGLLNSFRNGTFFLSGRNLKFYLDKQNSFIPKKYELYHVPWIPSSFFQPTDAVISRNSPGIQSLTIAIVFELIYYTNGHFYGMADIHEYIQNVSQVPSKWKTSR